MPTQLGINHGSAAGPDSQVSNNAPTGVSDDVNDNVHDANVLSHSSAMQRGFSPLGAGTAPADVGALDEALTDDSFGVTPSPDKNTPMRGRARSLLRRQVGGRPPLTKRSVSLSQRPASSWRASTRVASPGVLGRLRNVSVPAYAGADSPVEIWLAAL